VGPRPRIRQAHRLAPKLAQEVEQLGGVVRQLLEGAGQPAFFDGHRRQAPGRQPRPLQGFVHQRLDAAGLRGLGVTCRNQLFFQHAGQKLQAPEPLAQVVVQVVADAALLAPADFQDLLLQLLAPGDVKRDAARPDGPACPARAFEGNATAHQKPAHRAIRQQDAVLHILSAGPAWIAGFPGRLAHQGAVVRVHVDGHLVRIELELVV
jgi:hypothetical protein